MASRLREFHPGSLSEPCMDLSIRTAPDVQPLDVRANSFVSSREKGQSPVSLTRRFHFAGNICFQSFFISTITQPFASA